eukprot:6196569-Prorocentrum_lima.AAC.1
MRSQEGGSHHPTWYAAFSVGAWIGSNCHDRRLHASEDTTRGRTSTCRRTQLGKYIKEEQATRILYR